VHHFSLSPSSHLVIFILFFLLKTFLFDSSVSSMPDHRSYQDPFYGWTTPKPISLCLQALKEFSSLPFTAIQKLISRKNTGQLRLVV
jgi:hypothetical protein